MAKSYPAGPEGPASERGVQGAAVCLLLLEADVLWTDQEARRPDASTPIGLYNGMCHFNSVG